MRKMTVDYGSLLVWQKIRVNVFPNCSRANKMSSRLKEKKHGPRVKTYRSNEWKWKDAMINKGNINISNPTRTLNVSVFFFALLQIEDYVSHQEKKKIWFVSDDPTVLLSRKVVALRQIKGAWYVFCDSAVYNLLLHIYVYILQPRCISSW